MEQTAVRLLMNILRTGLFENPYLEVEKTVETVGNPDFMAAGFEAQLKSIVMLKNAGNVLPLDKNMTVYIPKKYFPARRGMFGFGASEERWDYPVNLEIIQKYMNVTENPEEADCALVFIDGPNGGSGYSREDVAAGGNGYVPITLQYKPYTAVYAREVSIAGGDPLEDFTNRSYKGKTVTASNTADLDLVLDTRTAMGEKPLIVVVGVTNPMVFSEFEAATDAILINFGVQDQAIMEIVSGQSEPSGLLPMQMPANMKTVEEQYEDVPRDMECYMDSEGNVYDFAYGLNWSGLINDARVIKYK
jgi:beta-glucosidase